MDTNGVVDAGRRTGPTPETAAADILGVICSGVAGSVVGEGTKVVQVAEVAPVLVNILELGGTCGSS